MIQTENEISKVAGKRYRDKTKEALRHKIYYELHKEQIAEQKKQYRLENIETIKFKKSIDETCVCGCVIRHVEMSRHLKTELHDRKLNIQLMKEQAFDDFFLYLRN